MKVGDSIKKRLDELSHLSDEELKKWADEMLEDAKSELPHAKAVWLPDSYPFLLKVSPQALSRVPQVLITFKHLLSFDLLKRIS